MLATCMWRQDTIALNVRYAYGVYALVFMYDMKVKIRDPPIMLIILPIMLCCTAQKFTYYA